MKGVIATDVIFLLVVIGLMVGAGLIIFWKWFEVTQVSEATCRLKQQNYCSELIAGKEPKWDEIPPKTGCEKFGIMEPSEEDCRELYGVG